MENQHFARKSTLHNQHPMQGEKNLASDIPDQAQAEATPTVSNATPEAFSAGASLLERLQPSLVTRQGGELTSRVWLNVKFRTKPWTQTVPGATQSPPDLIEDEVCDPESALSDSEPEVT